MFVLGPCGAIKNDGVGITERGQLCHRVSGDAYSSEGANLTERGPGRGFCVRPEVMARIGVMERSGWLTSYFIHG